MIVSILKSVFYLLLYSFKPIFRQKQSKSIKFGSVFARNSPNQSSLGPFSRKTVQISQVWVRFREKQSKSIRFGFIFAKNSPNQSGLGPFSRETIQISQVWVRFREKQSKPVRFLLFSARMDPFGRVLIVSRSNRSIQIENEWLYAKSHSF